MSTKTQEPDSGAWRKWRVTYTVKLWRHGTPLPPLTRRFWTRRGAQRFARDAWTPQGRVSTRIWRVDAVKQQCVA